MRIHKDFVAHSVYGSEYLLLVHICHPVDIMDNWIGNNLWYNSLYSWVAWMMMKLHHIIQTYKVTP